MLIDQPLLRAAGNVADLLLADDYAAIDECQIEPLAKALRQFLLDHGIAGRGISGKVADCGAGEPLVYPPKTAPKR